jgi:predicted kinase
VTEWAPPTWKIAFDRLALIPDHLMGKAVFLMGPTGAGKSTFAASKWLKFAPKKKSERSWKFQPPESAPSKKERRGPPSYFHVVNPDDFKEEIPGFDRKAPQKVHELSVDMADAYFDGILETGEPLVIDGTGAGYKRIAMNMSLAKEMGYHTTLVFLYVPLLVAMARNADRSRSVPVSVVVNTWFLSKKNFPNLKTIADKADSFDMTSPGDKALIAKHLGGMDRHLQRMYKKNLVELLQEQDPSGAKQYSREIASWLSTQVKEERPQEKRPKTRRRERRKQMRLPLP